MNIEHRQVEANGVSLHVADAGTGLAVLFVHSFPDTWRGWRRQMEAIVSAGHRAIFLDMRGYGESAKPNEFEAYTVFQCVGDLVGVLDALAIEQAVLGSRDEVLRGQVATGLVCPVAYPGHHGVARHHGGWDVGDHLIEDAVWQRMLAALETVPYMHLHDPGRLHRFVSACFVVMRTNLTWAELGCLVPSAEAAKRRFRSWARRFCCAKRREGHV